MHLKNFGEGLGKRRVPSPVASLWNLSRQSSMSFRKSVYLAEKSEVQFCEFFNRIGSIRSFAAERVNDRYAGPRACCDLSDSGFPEGLLCDSLSSWQIWGHEMGRSHPMALRERVVAFVEEGHSHRAAGARFRVSVKFVNDMVILKRKTGRLDPRAQGNGGGHGKLASLRGWIEARMVAKPDLTLNDLVLELADRHSITIHRVSVWRVLRSLGLTHKKRHPSRRTEAA